MSKKYFSNGIVIMAKKRWVKKGRKSKGWKKTGRRRIRKGKRIINLVPRLNLTKHMIPDEVRTTMCLRVAGAVGVRVNNSYLSFYANSFGDGTNNTEGCGPQINFTGAFALNYPGGHYNMCSTPNPAGSTGLFSKYRVINSLIEGKFTMNRFTDATGNIFPVPSLRVAVIPSAQTTFTGLSSTTLFEQPYVKETVLPNPMTAISEYVAGVIQQNRDWVPLDTSLPKWLKARSSTGKILGVPKSAPSEDLAYACTYNANMANANKAYWHIAVVGDAVNNFAYTYDIKLLYDVIYFNRNQIFSGQNV